MKTIAIYQNPQICAGLRFAGAETHHITTEEELIIVLESLQTTDNLVILDPTLAELEASKKFIEENPNSLITKGPKL